MTCDPEIAFKTSILRSVFLLLLRVSVLTFRVCAIICYLPRRKGLNAERIDFQCYR